MNSNSDGMNPPVSGTQDNAATGERTWHAPRLIEFEAEGALTETKGAHGDSTVPGYDHS